MLIHVVNEGDTVDLIANEYQISPASIIYNNQISYPYNLAVGEALLLSVPNTSLQENKRALYSGGYAYPFISRWVLTQTLPYLTYLYVFSYGFTTDGYLIPPALDDRWMIQLSLNLSVSPVLTLTPFGPDGNFNNNLISAIVNDPVARARLRDNIILEITTKGFQGLDIDFEYIRATDKNAFVEFVAYMKEAVSQLGYPVSVALAPKTSDTQTGLLYEGKDYARLGAIADYVLLMTYEWGYKFGPPLAVAPIDKVREVVTYASSVIPPEKIQLGIPNYGYDWTLPYEKGKSAATTIGVIEAVQIAVKTGSRIQFDEISQSPFFYYSVNSTEHVVWFEDVRSIRAKFDLVNEFQLRGVTYWQIMQLFRANWLLFSEYFFKASKPNP